MTFFLRPFISPKITRADRIIRNYFVLLLAGVGLSLGPLCAARDALATSAGITGRVGSQGVFVAGAKLVLASTDGTLVAETYSDWQGEFSIDVSPGDYQLVVTHFDKKAREKIAVKDHHTPTFVEVELRSSESVLARLMSKYFPTILGSCLGALLGLSVSWFTLFREKRKSSLIFGRHLCEPLKVMLRDIRSFVDECRGPAYRISPPEEAEEVSHTLCQRIDQMNCFLDVMEKSYGEIFAKMLPTRFAQMANVRMAIANLKYKANGTNALWTTIQLRPDELYELLDRLDKTIDQIMDDKTEKV